MILATWILAASLLGSSEFSQFRKTWALQPADPARPGLWRARGSTPGSSLHVRVDTAAGGELLRLEWSAESGVRETDIPEEAFWSILDGLSQGREWVETDPDALPSGAIPLPAARIAQGFRCPSCQPPLVAATWNPHGGTRLLIARTDRAKRPPSLDVTESVSEDGIRSLARQQALGVESSNPCKDGIGACSLDLSGSRGERWSFARGGSQQAWHLADASFPGPPWWNPEWDWDSLRIESPREFRLILKNWLDAEIDVDGARLLRPLEPILAMGVSDWTSRTLPGIDPGPTIDRLIKLSSPPSALVICETPSFRLSVDTFGRRKLEVQRGLSR